MIFSFRAPEEKLPAGAERSRGEVRLPLLFQSEGATGERKLNFRDSECCSASGCIFPIQFYCRYCSIMK